MSAGEIAQAVLLAAGCALALAGGLGTVLSRDVYARLHFVTLVSSLAVPLVVVAVVLAEWGTGEVAEVLAGGLLVWLTSPVIGHATARAVRARETGDWRTVPEAGAGSGGQEERP